MHWSTGRHKIVSYVLVVYSLPYRYSTTVESMKESIRQYILGFVTRSLLLVLDIIDHVLARDKIGSRYWPQCQMVRHQHREAYISGTQNA